MKGVRIGHFTKDEQGTGVSVFIFDQSAVGSYHLCGSSPASHELGAMELDANVTHIDGLLFTGGSAFGLAAVNGMMKWFREQKKGWHTANGFIVPIIPAAAIFDLAVKLNQPPTDTDAYEACVTAREDNEETGRIGAGTGASVGKIVPGSTPMSGGLGRAEIHLPNGICVLAYAVVNSVGDVRNQQGDIIAGARLAGQFADCEAFLLSGEAEKRAVDSNTTLVALFTNAKFSKAELKRISKMAIAGMARAITPIFTRYDGDMIFSFSVGEEAASELLVGNLAAKATQLAIENAVQGSIDL